MSTSAVRKPRAAARALEPRTVRVGKAGIYLYDAGKGPAVVLLHGFNHHAEAFVRNIAPLADAGHRVIALDLPGFGRSGMPEMSYSLRGYSDFVARLLDALDIERANIVGNSMGGAIALSFALDRPERVITVTGVDPAGMFEAVPKMWAFAATPVARFLMRPFLGHPRLLAESHRRAYHDPTLSSPLQVDRIAEAYLQPGYRDHILAMAESMFTAPDEELLWNRLPNMEPSTLIMWGRQDRTLPLRHAYRAAQRIPNAELIVYESCGHLPMYERSEEFNRDLIAFVAAHKG
jgi:4,5:9,10-diseco-3-hydroxy-5,9,17-trioxoandrosta-1(10),2-diene-4-oate hydrolase